MTDSLDLRPWLDDGDVQLYHGDVRDVLDTLPSGIARTCITSPPYWGLRDYGTGRWEGGDADCSHLKHDDLESQFAASSTLAGTRNQLDAARAKYAYRDVCGRCGARRIDSQIGLEPTFGEFLESIVDVFRSVRRVLADDGTLWINMGDSYAGAPNGATGGRTTVAGQTFRADKPFDTSKGSGCKPKDLVGQPWAIAFALRADGWYLRRDIIWHKPNAMPESVTDRPGTSHEYVFLLSKSPRYYYDDLAARTPLAPTTNRTWSQEPRAADPDDRFVRSNAWGRGKQQRRYSVDADGNPLGARYRSVWSIPTTAYPGAHFATFPPALVEPCILAGTAPGDIVLDPFMGSGTTAAVARHHGRRAIGTELNEEYLQLAAARLSQQSLFNGGAA